MEHCELCGSQVEIMGKTTKWYRSIEIERSSELLEEIVKLKEQLKEAEEVIKAYTKPCTASFYNGAGKQMRVCGYEAVAREYFKNKEEKKL